MLVAILLMCNIQDHNQCSAFMHPSFFKTVEECEGAAGGMLSEVLKARPDMGPVEYQCVDLNYDFPNA